MTDLQNLLIRKANVTARLAAMTEGAIGDKPDANTAAGTPIGHVAYRDSLLAELKTINELILAEREIIAATANIGGPFEINS